ncbi:hypothetical protein ET445_06060 [Agromyces protaetiae]|uniref:Ig-like domain repeat protein n=1 Tax=Agromyces protaetiae TaxID=2509455 RepID=A0A4P6FDB5_9MICO|nr:hypothetical protein [Agromyces protaetiae]QAY72973.1 hypothetical protein ET445_06060 [Agromyces protaetiae]
MKRTFSALAVSVLAAGLAVAGAAMPASADGEAPATPTATVEAGNCLVLNVDLSDYAVDPGTPAVEKVSHTDYIYLPVHGSVPHIAHKDEGDFLIYDWTLYYKSGTQEHVTTEPKNAIPGVANTVSVTIDGAVHTEDFGSDFTESYQLDDKFESNTYTVTVTAFGETEPEVYSGTVPACGVGAWNAAATFDAEAKCGTATVNVSNVALSGDKINGTVSVVPYVDGTAKAEDILALAEGATKTLTYSFPEDSGDHKVVVRTGPAHGDTILAQTLVSTDCIGNVKVTGNLQVGGAITVTGDHFQPDTEYTIELHSDPQVLGTVTTDGAGEFTLPTTIPAGTPAGDHEVAALSDGVQISAAQVTIAAAAAVPAANTTPAATKAGLAETGFNGLPFAIGALALVAVGAVAVGASRAKRAARTRG